MNRGIVIRQDAKAIHLLAKAQNLAVEAHGGYELPWPRTLFLDPVIHVPWELLPRGMDFLDAWEAAAPMWSYETLISDVATGQDRKRTEALIGDLRVPMYCHELLFVRDGEGGKALLAAWQEEIAAVPEGDPRVAFVRALYRVKPLFLALPRSWLTTAREMRRAVRPAALPKAPVAQPTVAPASAGVEAGTVTPPPMAPRPAAISPRPRRSKARKPSLPAGLVRVEVAPNRYVTCKPGDEEKVKAEWLLARLPRRARRAKG